MATEQSRDRTVGVVLPFDTATRQHLSDPFFLSMLGSVADALSARGFDMLLARVDPDKTEAAAEPFDAGRVAGIVLIGQWRQHEQLNQMAKRGVPIVAWGAQLPQQHYVTVGGDNVNGGMLATEHLIRSGRKSIAFFGDINVPEVAQRYRGYCNALASHGLPVDPQLRVSVSFVPEGGAQAVEEMARRSVAYDAVFACSDLLAMTAINALRRIGKDVPRDIATVGYDDLDMARYFYPPLSTVRQPMPEAGAAMVSSLLALVQGKAAQSLQLPTKLIVRASSLAPEGQA